MKKKMIALALTVSMALPLIACGNHTAENTASTAEETQKNERAVAEGESYTINVASTFAPEGPVHQVMEEFKTNLESSSGGRIKVVIHPSGALGGAREVAEGLHAGTIEMGAMGCEDFEYYAPEYSILEAPFCFEMLNILKHF